MSVNDSEEEVDNEPSEEEDDTDKVDVEAEDAARIQSKSGLQSCRSFQRWTQLLQKTLLSVMYF